MHLQVVCLCSNGAATKLRLIEPACGGFTVQGGGGRKVLCSFLLLALWWTVLAAMTMHLHLMQVVCLGSNEAATKLRLIEQACGCFMM